MFLYKFWIFFLFLWGMSLESSWGFHWAHGLLLISIAIFTVLILPVQKHAGFPFRLALSLFRCKIFIVLSLSLPWLGLLQGKLLVSLFIYLGFLWMGLFLSQHIIMAAQKSPPPNTVHPATLWRILSPKRFCRVSYAHRGSCYLQIDWLSHLYPLFHSQILLILEGL